MKTIKASEIGSYMFCNRAWSYRRQGIETLNQAELAAGTKIHHQHSQAVVAAGCLRTAAIVILLGAIMLFFMHLTIQIL